MSAATGGPLVRVGGGAGPTFPVTGEADNGILAAFFSTGQVAWAEQSGGLGALVPYGAEYLAMAGWFTGECRFGAATLLDAGIGSDGFVALFTATTGAFEEVSRTRGSGSTFFDAMVSGAGETLAVIGRFESSSTLNGFESNEIPLAATSAAYFRGQFER